MRAFVTTLFRDKDDQYSYLDPALICANSLRKFSDYDRVCLVQKPCPEDIKILLLTVYTSVKEVPLIEPHPSWYGYTLIYPKGHPFTRVFTKFHAFDLIQYEKVLLVDLDFICLANIDDLFDLETPAMSFERLETVHGELVSEHLCDLAKKDHASGNAGLILWTPDHLEYTEILKELSKPGTPLKNLAYNQQYGFFKEFPELVNFYVFPEQDYLTAKYNGKIHYISYIYGSNDYKEGITKGVHIYGDTKRWFWQIDNGGICEAAKRDVSTDMFQQECIDYLLSTPEVYKDLLDEYFLKYLNIYGIQRKIIPFKECKPGPLFSSYLNKLIGLMTYFPKTKIAIGKDWELHQTQVGYWVISDKKILGTMKGTRTEALIWASKF